MANPFMYICLMLLATPLANSARILDELTPTLPLPDDTADTVLAVVAPPATYALPSGQIPAISAVPTANAAPIAPTEPAAPVMTPIPPAPQPLTNLITTAPSGGATISGNPTAGPQPVTTPATTTIPYAGDPPVLSFFMHGILGGVVTGIVANSGENNLPFLKPHDQIFPLNGGNQPSDTLIQFQTNSNNQAFVAGGQLPQGLTLQQLMFGSVTVVDDEITAGHELGAAVLGKVQGFYTTSSTDGTSHTLMITAAFDGGDGDGIADTISFFGVHRTATPMSHVAIVGGTGKYENARGYATIEAIPLEDEHTTTDGLEAISHFTLFLTP